MAGNSEVSKEPSRIEQHAELAPALERLWRKFLPEIQERVRIIEEALVALESGQLAELQRDQAFQAAHKLAGSLGNFGHQRASAIASTFESAFEKPTPAPNYAELQGLLLELQRTVQTA